MSSESEEVLNKALALSPIDRAELIERLLGSLESTSDTTIDSLWAEEAEARIEAYDRNEITSIPVKEVFDRINQM